MGLVPQVFNERTIDKLPGTRAIGHVRYSTTGSSTLENAQPIVVDCARGQLAIGHNGNLVNAHLLRDELEADGAIFKTTVDSEVILHLMAQPSSAKGDSALVQSLAKVKGAFSLVLMSEREIVGVRDSLGFRPLCIGKVDDAWLLSSESCAFDIIPGAQFVRDVEPGEIVVIDEKGLRSIKPFVARDRLGFCIFEYVYFARPDSTVEGENVQQGAHQHGPRAGAPASGRGRPGHSRARLGQLRGARLQRGIGHPVRPRLRPQPLRRPHLPQSLAARA